MSIQRSKQRRTMLGLVLACTWLAAFSFQTAPSNAYLVNSLADTSDGACDSLNCTLRDALTAAMASPAADTVTFSLSGTINLLSTLPTITSAGGELTIDGLGQTVVVSGGDAVSLFFTMSGSNLTLRNIELEDGHAPVSGGAVYSSGTLLLDNVIVNSCQADDYGGAIYSQGTLTIRDSGFSNNAANSYDGGAIYIYKGTAEISGSSFMGNNSLLSGGAIYNRYHSEYQGGDLTIHDSRFEQNTSSASYGGAIANQGNLTVNGSGFYLNSAEDGGGAFFNKSGGKYLFEDCQLNLNMAALGSGGAIFVQDIPTPGSGSVRDSEIKSNIATQNGGGFYVSAGTVNFTRTRLFNNSANLHGGGGYNASGMVYLIDASVENNAADLDGGGFYSLGKMAMERSTFSGNHAAGLGGGIYYSDETEISQIKNSTFYDNDAEQGGGIYSRADLQVVNATLSANSANAGEGGGFNANSSTSLYNSIVANSTSGGNCKTTAHPSNWGDNIDSGTSCDFGTLHDSHSSTDPLLGPLKNNGGWTKTMMPQPGSLAIDGVTYIPPAHRLPEDDQRLFSRPYGAFNDIGAVEGYYRFNLPVIRR